MKSQDEYVLVLLSDSFDIRANRCLPDRKKEKAVDIRGRCLPDRNTV